MDINHIRPILRYLAGFGRVDPGLVPAYLQLDSQQRAFLLHCLKTNALEHLGFSRFEPVAPDLAADLRGRAREIVATSGIQLLLLSELDELFQKRQLPVVFLKGAALNGTVYAGLGIRSMSDIDIWVRPGDLPKAIRAAESHGYSREMGGGSRAFDLGQEVKLVHGEFKHLLVEFHTTPFKGWWLHLAAKTQSDEVWSRSEPLSGYRIARQMSAEDTVLHLALHLAVNHQFGQAPLRTLIDLALTTHKRTIDWHEVTCRAERWNVRTAVWMSLDLTRELLDLQESETAWYALRPAPFRRRLLSRFVNPRTIIAGHDLRQTRWRTAFLLLLVDRVSDAFRLVVRTVLP